MAKALTVKRVEKLISAGVRSKTTDADVRGLMLCVEGKQSAHWLLRWQRDGRVRHMGLGSASDLPLAAAREKAREQRERIARDIDPLELKRKDREAQREAEAKRHTFRAAAEACHTALEPGWSSAHHAAEFINSLERFVFPIIGNLDVAAIDKDSVLRVLEQQLPSRIKGANGGTFWTAKTITADRVRSRVERVLSFAEARGWRAAGTPNPARWRGFLDVLLAKPRKIAPVRHMRSAAYSEVPKLIATLAADQDVAAQCLQFIILTACRLSEAIKATWDEIHFDSAEWRIPASRVKTRKPHIVPLSAQVIQLLHSLYRESGNPHLFISNRTAGQHVVESTLTIALRRAGCGATIHGFRSSFRTFCEERTSFPSIVAEMALAHAVGSSVERSYRRTDLFAKRAKLMQAWGAFCTTPPVAGEKNVLTMRGAAR
jgi:integrase